MTECDDYRTGKEKKILTLGKRLKKLRNEKILSQEVLATQSGVTKSSISQIENDRLSPSISTLRKIAKALGVRITYFFEEEDIEGSIHIVRRDEHRFLTFDNPTERWQILASGIHEGKIVGVITSLGPGETGAEEVVVDPGEMKLTYMLRGKAEFIYNGQIYEVEEGDSFYYDGGVSHNWRNTGDIEVHALVVITK